VAIEAPGMLDDRYEFVELDRPSSGTPPPKSMST
jgi:hypothetical protein